MKENKGSTTETRGYAPINGLKMYYEIQGTGDPLVYIPPVFGYAGLKSFPALIENHSVITVDVQGHGRTADIPERPMTLQQNTKDVVGLLKHLGISKADFFGESYGGVMATMIAVHHPELARRVATYGATFGPPQVAHNMEMLRMSAAPTPDSSSFHFQRESYKKVAPDPDYWPKFWTKVCSIQWGGFSNEELASIKAPFLIVLGDHDFVRLEHAVDTLKLIPNARTRGDPGCRSLRPFFRTREGDPSGRTFLEKDREENPDCDR